MYNGWSNYETWNMSLWYGDYIADLLEDADLDAEQVKDIVEECISDQYEETGFVADAVRNMLFKVNWEELVDNHKPDDGE